MNLPLLQTLGYTTVLNTGGPRIEPHPDRKFSAGAAIERKRAFRRPLSRRSIRK